MKLFIENKNFIIKSPTKSIEENLKNKNIEIDSDVEIIEFDKISKKIKTNNLISDKQAT
jgi:hypothetical protein